MRTIVLTAAAAAALCLIAFTEPMWSDAPAADQVDAVIGEGGFNIFCPIVPGNGVPHETQVTRRLTVIEMLLRQRDVTSWPAGLRAERARNLDRLHQYRLAASYPRNYDRPSELLPCFIDRDGRICAVGYLVEQSAGHGFAEKINARHQYETIAQMHEPELDRWIARSGLTLAELETIQEPESWPEEQVVTPEPTIAVRDTVSPRRSAPRVMPPPQVAKTLQPRPAATSSHPVARQKTPAK